MSYNKILLPLDLQLFADEDDFENPEPNDNEDYTSGEDDLIEAIRALNSEEDLEDEDEDSDEYEDEEYEEEDEDEYEEEDEEEYEDDEDESDEEDEENDEEEEPGRRTQSKEENARFAQQRRERETQARIDAEIERLRNESPEFQLARQLSEQFGRPVEAIMEEMREAELTRQAQERDVPVEVLRQIRDAEQRSNGLEAQINQLRFESWQNKIQADSEALKTQYQMLSQDDIDDAVDYILNTARNVDIPLEDAVYAVHGKKIIDNLAKAKVQEDLAKQSGRSKKTPLAPTNGKASKVTNLSADERAIAKAFGMTDDEYKKYKS